MIAWNAKSNIADVLSLGPRTAGNLARTGIRTAADLWAADPQRLALRLGDERICAATIAAWQHEARLVCAAPQLSGMAARVLTAIGFKGPQHLARTSPLELLAAIETYRTATDAPAWLVQMPLPSINEASAWIGGASESLRRQAA